MIYSGNLITQYINKINYSLFFFVLINIKFLK